MTTQHDERVELARELVRLADIHRDCGRLVSKDGTAERVMRQAAALLAAEAQAGGEVVDTGSVFPEWKAGTSAFKQWCCQYFGPDADESYLAEAVLQLPRKQILPMKAADEFELHRLLAEERYTVRQLNRALREATEAPTFMGEPATRPQPAAQVAQPLTDWDFIRAHHHASQAGFLAGTSNWAHHMLRALRRGIGKDQA